MNMKRFSKVYKLLTILILLSAKNYTQTGGGELMIKDDFIPQWAKKVVWYQIFPERFRNGDPGNDPDIESLEGAWPHDSTSPWQVHPWNSDWYELQPYEKENGKEIWFNIQRRRYGGDLKGIIDKLDYLKELGVGALYLNPVFWAPSLHKYDAITYHHIDPHFGPDPEGDKKKIAGEINDDPSKWVWTSADKLFLQLIDEVHKREMKIIIDGVFNHMGIRSWIFHDVIKNQKRSKYKDWFSVTSWDDTIKGTEFGYEGWFGVKELPEFKEDDNGIVEGPKNYIFQITKRWMDPDNDGNPSDGIDGWRLDVAFCIKHKFWKDWRRHVKSINPEAYITAELVDPPDQIAPYLKGDEFDAVMNYNFLYSCSEFFVDEKTRITVSEFDKKLKELRDAFPDCVSYVQQNLLDSHDTQRITSHIINKDMAKIRNWGETFEMWKGSNPDYNTSKPGYDEYRILKLIIIFQMTYIGAPYIYYGDEAGMWGANDPCCRKPMVWDDFKYRDEIFLPDQNLREKPGTVSFNTELFEHYKRMISIRNSYPALQLGDFRTLLTDDGNEIYAFERKSDLQSIMIILNNSDSLRTITLETDHNEYYTDLLNGDMIVAENGEISFKIDKKWGRILLKDYYK